MKILYITQYFSPEPGAASIRAKEFSENWSNSNTQVCVLTGFPTYLQGKIYKGYKNKFFQKELFGSIEVIRTFTVTYPKISIFKRILSQINFTIFISIFGLFIRDVNIIIVSSPPFLLGIVGFIIGSIKGIPWIFEARDLFPDSAVAFRVLKNKMLISFLKKLEKLFYRKSALVVAATHGLRKEIISMGIPENKVLTILNGVNVKMFRPDSANMNYPFLKTNRIPKHIIVYSGLIGKAHGTEKIIDLAIKLNNPGQIGFLFVGGGTEKNTLIKKVKDANLENVFFLGPKPYEEVPNILSSADIGIASLSSSDLTLNSIPVKIFDYMASGIPVILLGSGEAAKIIEDAKAGIAVDQDNLEAAATWIMKLLNNKALLQEISANGRRYVEAHYSREKQSQFYLNKISSLCRHDDHSN